MFKHLVIVIIILVIYYIYMMNCDTENYRSCSGCAPMKKISSTVLNPFVMPYSGTDEVSSAFIISKESPDNEVSKISHLTTPDHVELV